MASQFTRQLTIEDFDIIYGRHASWIDYNVLRKDRDAIPQALRQFFASGFLRNPSHDYKPRDLIYYGSEYEHRGVKGVLGLILAADGIDEPIRNVLVLAVQVPLSPETARAASRTNCYVTTEIYPGDHHSVVPVSYEFARGTIPAKRLNYVVGRDGLFQPFAETIGVTTGFKHLVSIEYSQYGIFQIDFQLSVRHRPLGLGEPGEEFPTSKREFLSKMRQEVSGPLMMIEHELTQDKGKLAPSDINPASFLDTISNWMAQAVYGNLAIFKEEVDSKINPRIHERGFAEGVHVPVEEEASGIDYDHIARVLVLYPGALAAILMLADNGPIEITNLIAEAILTENSLETLAELRSTNLLGITGTTLWLTELGDMIVSRLRSDSPTDEVFYVKLG